MNRIKTILLKVKMLKVRLPKVKMPSIKIPKISILKPKVNIEKIKPFLSKTLNIAKGLINLSIKAVKGFIRWFGKAIKESIAQVWTLLGFFIAWLTLTGTAQQIVGIATIAATVLWLITIPLREEKE